MAQARHQRVNPHEVLINFFTKLLIDLLMNLKERPRLGNPSRRRFYLGFCLDFCLGFCLDFCLGFYLGLGSR